MPSLSVAQHPTRGLTKHNCHFPNPSLQQACILGPVRRLGRELAISRAKTAAKRRRLQADSASLLKQKRSYYEAPDRMRSSQTQLDKMHANKWQAHRSSSCHLVICTWAQVCAAPTQGYGTASSPATCQHALSDSGARSLLFCLLRACHTSISSQSQTWRRSTTPAEKLADRLRKHSTRSSSATGGPDCNRPRTAFQQLEPRIVMAAGEANVGSIRPGGLPEPPRSSSSRPKAPRPLSQPCIPADSIVSEEVSVLHLIRWLISDREELPELLPVVPGATMR